MSKPFNVRIRFGATHNDVTFAADGRQSTVDLASIQDPDQRRQTRDNTINATQQWARRNFTGYAPMPNL